MLSAGRLLGGTGGGGSSDDGVEVVDTVVAADIEIESPSSDNEDTEDCWMDSDLGREAERGGGVP